jgi:KaiC/GvpD/RAD55 family RecA-like ATPase
MQNPIGAARPPNPFNPGSPVDPADFVGRVQELENFRQKLRQTAGGSLASMAVAGWYGVGKTSFLHKCKAIADEQNALVIYFSLNEIDEFTRERLARVLVERVKEKVREEVIFRRISDRITKAVEKIRIKTESGLEFSFAGGPDTSYPNLQSALKAAWDALKGSKTAIVFLIDEAQTLYFISGPCWSSCSRKGFLS